MSWASYKGVDGAIVFYDNAYNNERWLDAIGEKVVKFLIEPGVTEPVDDTTGDPTRLIAKVTETGGGGDTTLVNAEEAGVALLLTTDNAEWDGGLYQAKNIAFKLEAGKKMYYGIKCAISEKTDSDLLVGLMVKDTACLLTAATHGIQPAGVEGIFFYKLDTEVEVFAKTFLDGVEKNSASGGDLADALAHTYEFYWDGSTLSMYFDNSLVAKFTENLPDTELTPSFEYRTGAAAAITKKIYWERAIKIG